MPGIGWECQCGKIIEEIKDFTWKFECANLNCNGGGHSPECYQKDWQAKETKLKELVDRHLATCSNSHKCSKCHKPFSYGDTYTKISNNPKAGDYHEKCWEEIEGEENDSTTTCHDCKRQIKLGEKYYSQVIPDSFSPQTVYYCKSCGEKKKNEGTPLPGSGKWLENNKCPKCGMLAVGGYCQVCSNSRGGDEKCERCGRVDQYVRWEKDKLLCASCRADDTLRNLKEKECPKCGYHRTDGKCHNSKCSEYYKKKNNLPISSKFKKGRCPDCGRSNVIINPETGLCNSCGMKHFRLMIQQMIKEEGLKEGQIEWERVKPQIEEMIRWLKQNGEQEVAKVIEKNIETIEGDLYPDRKKNKGGSAWIWILVIGGILVVGIIGLVIWKKKRK